MPRYWVIAPFRSKPSDVFDRIWQFDLANGLISIGWSEAGDVSKMSRETLAETIASQYPEEPPGARRLYASMLWAFYHEIGPGDMVVARRGRKLLAAVGKVISSAAYMPGKNPGSSHPNYLKVEWQNEPRDKAFSNVVFPMQTLAELSDANYHNLVAGHFTQQPVGEEASEAIEDPNAFVLEKYLEDFIVSNFDAIFKGQLQIYEDADEKDGQQYPTDVGPIDILAFEPKSNSFVVIELKKGRPSDQVVGQTLRYMGWVKKNLCTGGKGVGGLVICRDPDPKLTYALEMIDNIEVRYYSVSFKLSETPPASC